MCKLRSGIFLSLATFFCNIFVVFMLSVNVAYSDTSVEIYGGQKRVFKIAINPLICKDYSNADIAFVREMASIAANDLRGSGFFTTFVNPDVDCDIFTESRNTIMSVGTREANYSLFVGGKNLGNVYKSNFVLFESGNVEAILENNASNKNGFCRGFGHTIADQIMVNIVGRPGYFNSKIMYITNATEGDGRKNINSQNGDKRIVVMDQDGYNKKNLTVNGMVMTPIYSKLHRQVIFSSYKDGQPRIKTLDLKTGKISDIAEKFLAFRGKAILSPQFSPSGDELVFSVVDDMGSDLYSSHIHHLGYKKLTKGGINVSPTYSPDGKYIAYSSDMSGKPAIYIMEKNGANPRRISSLVGAYYEPAWSGNGKWIAFTKILLGKFYIGIISPDGSREKILSTQYLAENPAWSPSGEEIIFSFKSSPRASSKLMIVSTDGDELRYLNSDGDTLDPFWFVVN